MKRFLFIILIIVSCLPLLSLLRPGFPVTHDGQDHIARIANFYASFAEGNVVPRWANNLNWGFGHPVLMFLYPLPSYTATLFHSLGMNFVDSTKMVFGLSYTVSILLMFLWMSDEWGDLPGFAGAVLYGFAPYRFVDLYVRGALGEHVAFVFLPLICWGIHGLSLGRSQLRWGVLLTMGIAGLLLSHNAISLMMVPIAALYGIYKLLFITKKPLLFAATVTVFSVAGFLLSGFFWIPAFFEGKYTLRDIVTKGEVINRMVPLTKFIYSPWNYGQGGEFTKQIGLIQLLLIAGGIVSFLREKERNKRILLGGMGILIIIVLLFMTDMARGIWSSFTLLQNFQFPWRFLTVIVFMSSIIGTIVVSQIPDSSKKMVVIVISVLLLMTTFHMWKPQLYKKYDESFFTGIYNSTTDTGESSPIWSTRFMEMRPLYPLEIATGSATVFPIKRTTTIRDYRVTVAEKSRLVENTLYFPGWQVFVDGQPVEVEFQDPAWRGRMTFWLTEGTHTVHIVFGDTKLRKVANGISVASACMLGIAIGIASLHTFNKKRKVIRRV